MLYKRASVGVAERLFVAFLSERAARVRVRRRDDADGQERPPGHGAGSAMQCPVTKVLEL